MQTLTSSTIISINEVSRYMPSDTPNNKRYLSVFSQSSGDYREGEEEEEL